MRVSGVREGIHLCQCECCGWGRPWSYSKLLSKVKSSLTNFISSFFMGTELLALCNPTVQKMQDSRLKLITLLNFVELVSMQRYIYSLYRNLNCLHKHDSYRRVYIQMFMKIYLGCIYTYRQSIWKCLYDVYIQCTWNLKIYVYIHIDSLYESVYMMYIYNVYELWKSMYIYI